MMSYIYELNNDKFKKFEFETWYHDDYWKTTPYFDNESIKKPLKGILKKNTNDVENELLIKNHVFKTFSILLAQYS